MLEKQNYQDNLDVTLRINGQRWGIVEARVELSKTTRPNFVDMIVTPEPDTVETLPADPTVPESEGGLLGTPVTLTVDNELSSERDLGNEETLLFKGRLANLSTAAEGAFEGLVYNAAHQMFKKKDPGSLYNTTVSIAEASETPQEIASNYGASAVQYGLKAETEAYGYKIRASEAINLVMEEAGMENYTLHLKNGGYDIGGMLAGRDIPVLFSEPLVTVGTILDTVAESSNSEYWFDRRGKFHFGAPRPEVLVDAHELQFITDTSAGKTTPNYRSVRVIGDGVVSEEGWTRATLRNSSPIRLSTNINDDEQDDNLADPTFTYRNMSITTREEAENAREKIVEKIKEQRKSGKITVVGMPEVRPYHAVEMPDSPTQRMGGERYAVNKVIHKLNSSDGFLTEMHVMGLRSEQETVWADDLDTSATEPMAASEYMPYFNGQNMANADTSDDADESFDTPVDL